MSVEDDERLVERAVVEVVNGGDLDAVDRFSAPGIARAAREWVAPFAPPERPTTSSAART